MLGQFVRRMSLRGYFQMPSRLRSGPARDVPRPGLFAMRRERQVIDYVVVREGLEPSTSAYESRKLDK